MLQELLICAAELTFYHICDMNFKTDIDKLIQTSLYILGKVRSCDMHKLYNILYFAESYHLASYGRPITGDEYIAMKFGPPFKFKRHN